MLTGCSGGGKSTLLAGMGARGWATVPEPGRRIIATGGPLPWADGRGFALRAIEMASEDVAQAGAGVTLFDRSALDALAWLDAAGEAVPEGVRGQVAALGYARDVFVVPPWPEIYQTDADRRHGFKAAVAEHAHLAAWLPEQGFVLHEVPKGSVEARADWLAHRLQRLAISS